MTPRRRHPHHGLHHVAAVRIIHHVYEAINRTLQRVLDGSARAPQPSPGPTEGRRDQAPTREDDRRRRAAGWAAAIAAALDDDQLTTAVARWSPPVPGIGRRSAHLARGDLIVWAVAVHRRRPDQPLHHALTAALADTSDARPAGSGGGPSWPPPVSVAATDGDLPEPPAVAATPLHSRLVAAVQRLEPAVDTDHGQPR